MKINLSELKAKQEKVMPVKSGDPLKNFRSKYVISRKEVEKNGWDIADVLNECATSGRFVGFSGAKLAAFNAGKFDSPKFFNVECRKICMTFNQVMEGTDAFIISGSKLVHGPEVRGRHEAWLAKYDFNELLEARNVALAVNNNK